MRLNLGCGHTPLKGWTNVDSHASEADVAGDIRTMDFEAVDEVLMSHTLEHIPWGQTEELLKRIHGWLRHDGRLTVEVPDMTGICAKKPGDWLRYIYGSQEHEGEYHRSGFTLASLSSEMAEAGFTIVLAKRFSSQNGHRVGMPCIRVVGVK